MNISNFHLGICIPLSYHMIPSAFFDSFIAMEKPNFTYFRTSNGPIDDMRNALTMEALAAGCTHMILMDTDQCYPVNTITKLLSHKLPVVGGMVNRRYPPFDPLLLKGDIGGYKTIEDWEPDTLVEVDATGTGCILFEMDVFRKMPGPWFRFRRQEGRLIGEDIGFCADLKAAGYKIYVDTAVEIGHLSHFQVTNGTWQLFKAIEAAKAKATEEKKLKEQHS
jgi:GT2 family glycosyltransferase